MAPQPGQHIQADIFLRNGAEVTVIDVAIVDPALPSYLAKESDTKSDVAADQREADKRARWRAIGERSRCLERHLYHLWLRRPSGWARQPINWLLFQREAHLKGRTLHSEDVHAEDEFCHSEVECAYDPQGKRA